MIKSLLQVCIVTILIAGCLAEAGDSTNLTPAMRRFGFARLRENIEPYTRYVRAEQEKIGKSQREVEELRQEIARLRGRVEMIGK